MEKDFILYKKVNHVNVEYFEYFITLADSTSISKAADKLFLSKQQLTRILAALEEEFHVTLINKTPNGISLTKDGEYFLKYAKEFTANYTALKHHFALQQKESETTQYAESAVCKIFLAPCFSILSNDLVKSLKKIAPNIKLIIYDKSNQLNEGWFEETAICFWALEILPEELILPNGNKLHSKHLSDLSSYYIYNKLLRQFNDTTSYGEELLTSTLSHAYGVAQHKENLNLVSSNIYHILDSVMQNNNICGVPDFILPKIKSLYPDIGFLHIAAPTSPIHVVYHENYTLTAADEVVIQFVKSYIQNLQLLSKQILNHKL